MRQLVSLIAAFLLIAFLVVQAQGPSDEGKGKDGGKDGGKGGGKTGGFKGGGGGAGFKNLQVIDANALPNAMQTFVQGLGLLDKGTCGYCHVEDRSSDEKPQKVMARKMISMVRELNARFADGKQHVTCYTCHRGSPMPLMAP